MTTITITLPDELAEKIKASDLSLPEFIEECVQEKLRRQAMRHGTPDDDIVRPLCAFLGECGEYCSNLQSK